MEHQSKSPYFKFPAIKLRVIALALFFIGAYLIAQQNDFITALDPYAVRDVVKHWGILSVVVFIFFYAIGLLLYIPGTLFTVAGALLFGKLYGFLVVWVAANIAINTSFFTVRLVGGKLLSQVQHPLILKMMNRLDDYPLQTIMFLRLCLFTAPVLNTVLALSNVRGIDHVRGSLLGTIMPTATVVFLTDWLLTHFYS